MDQVGARPITIFDQAKKVLRPGEIRLRYHSGKAAHVNERNHGYGAFDKSLDLG